MEKKYSRIRIEQIMAGKAFGYELYLEMPKNGKMILLVAPGDEIRAELLDRLKEATPPLYAVLGADDLGSSGNQPPYNEGNNRASAARPLDKEEKPASVSADDQALITISGAEEMIPPTTNALPPEARESDQTRLKGYPEEALEQVKILSERPHPDQDSTIIKDVTTRITEEAHLISSSPPPGTIPLKETSAVYGGKSQSTPRESAEDPNPQGTEIPPSLQPSTQTPWSAGYLAAHLAYALGYVSATYLFDLALSATLYFAKKNGLWKPPLNQPTPGATKLTEHILSPPDVDQDSPLADAREIIELLETYFDSPYCDPGQKSFSHLALVSTLESPHWHSMRETDWNLARWRQLLGAQPSRNARRICARAAKDATKQAQSLLLTTTTRVY